MEENITVRWIEERIDLAHELANRFHRLDAERKTDTVTLTWAEMRLIATSLDTEVRQGKNYVAEYRAKMRGDGR